MALIEAHPLVFIILSLLVAPSTSSANSGDLKLLRLGGPWRPITDPKDHKVLEIAKFAVDEHNKLAKTNLRFQNVINGTMKVVGGRIYRFVISARDGNAPDNYLALVYEKPWQHSKFLISFKKVFQRFLFLSFVVALDSNPVDNWRVIENVEDPKVKGVGEFAVKAHNEEKNTHLVFEHVIGGVSQFDHGIRNTYYMLFISAKDGHASHKYGTFVRTWLHNNYLVEFKQEN
ncbi:hypothetical protein BUALT_Bualt03G0086500 [Buddleja alternifolia]|uniref:Cystatin domain-containing protein n=1 Tax=Buddleja alternifolia TaxID=168488 RepID=A0AAV6XWF5_9LAMI|nr:hypothetical protein BUALT_Bualt03G0086500 [Buddleja alternifolia]